MSELSKVKNLKRRVFFIFVILTILFLSFFIISLSSVWCFFLSNFYEGKKNVEEQEVQYYQYFENDYLQKQSSSGVVSLVDQIDGFLSYTDLTLQKDVLISEFGTSEFECFGSCFCGEEEEEASRRNSHKTSSVLIRGVSYLLAAVSSVVAMNIAEEYFSENCYKKFSDICEPPQRIRSEIEKCEHIMEIVIDEDEYELGDFEIMDKDEIDKWHELIKDWDEKEEENTHTKEEGDEELPFEEEEESVRGILPFKEKIIVNCFGTCEENTKRGIKSNPLFYRPKAKDEGVDCKKLKTEADITLDPDNEEDVGHAIINSYYGKPEYRYTIGDVAFVKFKKTVLDSFCRENTAVEYEYPVFETPLDPNGKRLLGGKKETGEKKRRTGSLCIGKKSSCRQTYPKETRKQSIYWDQKFWERKKKWEEK